MAVSLLADAPRKGGPGLCQLLEGTKGEFSQPQAFPDRSPKPDGSFSPVLSWFLLALGSVILSQMTVFVCPSNGGLRKGIFVLAFSAVCSPVKSRTSRR